MIDRVLRVSAALVCIAAVLPTMPSAAADDAIMLLAKHQSYVGWHEGDGVVKTLRAAGIEKSSDGRTIAAIAMVRYGIAQRTVTINDLGIENDEGFTGSVYWSSGSNGFIVRPVGEVAKAIYDRTALFGELTGDMTPTVQRHEVINGIDTVVIRLTSTVGSPMDVFVDPATGAYKRAVIDPGGKYELTFDGIEYTERGGKHFLSTYRYGDLTSVFTYTKIDVNVPVAPGDLHPPPQTATWTFGGGTTTVEPPNEKQKHILVTLEMNGVAGKFVLQTGAAFTAITESYARRVTAKRLAMAQISGLSGSEDAGMYQVDTLSVGSSTLHNIIVFSDAREDDRQGIVGYIGWDLLAGAIVDLDLDTGTLRVEDPAKVEPNQNSGVTLRADLSDQRIRVPMKLNGTIDVIATLDSGNSSTVLFPRDLIKRGLPFLVNSAPFSPWKSIVGLGGAREQLQCGKLGSLEIGPIKYESIPACSTTYEDHFNILLGIDFMKSFNYVFDYPDGIIVMTPRK